MCLFLSGYLWNVFYDLLLDFVEEGKIVIVARPRRRVGDFGSRKSEDDDSHGKKKKELLQEKLEVSENLIKSLQSEVLALREELDRVKSLNVELVGLGTFYITMDI